MFDFVRKNFLWDAWDNHLDAALAKHNAFHLKSIQDLAVFAQLKDLTGRNIAEIGGGDSRILRALAKSNSCVNVEKFEGNDGGPATQIRIPGVTNVLAYLGENSSELRDNSFDAVFSVSVIEHVPDNALAAFFTDGLRILKPGGLWLHAIDLYIEDEVPESTQKRVDTYRGWVRDSRVQPKGEIFAGPVHFTCDMATNPDNTMYSWGRISPKLIPLRQRAQSVSIILAATKK
ncbi:MAG: class I SAM-dependent methyltransferase [Parvibaculum sp.]|uniref:methyltransferase domain-containing protein n=1 Tax=Parvibaculum sp. TaxID=2024848 RepID=UPI0025F496F6|nr:methyltransferase domain-containing protein [Parvibaculum sp.]MCE9649664.1 class I SAM-dependent methyltransferase [Parvibaculum sp.]